jgi:hypothetical protein
MGVRRRKTWGFQSIKLLVDKKVYVEGREATISRPINSS